MLLLHGVLKWCEVHSIEALRSWKCEKLEIRDKSRCHSEGSKIITNAEEEQLPDLQAPEQNENVRRPFVPV